MSQNLLKVMKYLSLIMMILICFGCTKAKLKQNEMQEKSVSQPEIVEKIEVKAEKRTFDSKSNLCEKGINTIFDWNKIFISTNYACGISDVWLHCWKYSMPLAITDMRSGPSLTDTINVKGMNSISRGYRHFCGIKKGGCR